MRAARCLLVLLLLATGSVASAQEAPEDVRAKALEVLADPRYQRDLPPQAAAPGEPVALPAPNAAPVVVPVLGAAAALVRLLLYVFLAVLLVLVLLGIFRWAVGRRRPVAAVAPADEGGEGERKSVVPVLPGDATRLAAEGRYGEAIHVLLLVAIRNLSERSRLSAEPARTSRELIRLLPLKGEGRQAFEALVRAVELTLFGGLPAGVEEWESSLLHYQKLTGRSA